MAILLITRPQYDLTTHYLFYWTRIIIDFAKAKSIQVVDLHTNRATRKAVEGVIKKKNPSLILLNGHGDAGIIAGHDEEHLIIAGDNDHILNNTIVYALSCKTGKILGPTSVTNGTRAYIGYEEDFNFWTTPEFYSKPLEDTRARAFLEPSNTIALSLLKGHTIENALERGKDQILKNIQELIATDSPEKFMIPDLLWNMNFLVYHGDKDATVDLEQK